MSTPEIFQKRLADISMKKAIVLVIWRSQLLKKFSIQTHFLEKREKRCLYRISTRSTRDSTGKVGAEIANCKTFFKLQLFSFWYNTNILRQCNLVFELVWCGVYKRLEIYHWQNSWCNFWKWEASTYHFK